VKCGWSEWRRGAQVQILKVACDSLNGRLLTLDASVLDSTSYVIAIPWDAETSKLIEASLSMGICSILDADVSGSTSCVIGRPLRCSICCSISCDNE
jgi:hypothetical protein